jgi:uncharacterized membrane protein YraQ (UPF0718 family)
MLTLLFGPQILAKVWPAAISTAYWFAPPLLALVAVAFYVASLRYASTLFRARREQLMALLEGKG